jgi:hypothetical protein
MLHTILTTLTPRLPQTVISFSPANCRQPKTSSPINQVGQLAHLSLNIVVIWPLGSNFGNSSSTTQTDYEAGVFLAAVYNIEESLAYNFAENHRTHTVARL